MEIRQWTNLGRDFHPRYPGHSTVMVISAAAAILGGVLAYQQQGETLRTVAAAFGAGVAAFLGWALSSELDPDHPRAGILAAVVVAFGQPFVGPPDLLALVWALGTFRIVNGITGLSPKKSDVGLYVAGSLLVGWLESPVLSAAAALALVVGWFVHRREPWLLWAGGSLVLASAALILFADSGPVAAPSILPALVLGAGLGACVWALRPGRSLRSTVDQGGGPIKPPGILAATGLAAGVLWLEWSLAPARVVPAWFPLWSALMVAVLYRPFGEPPGRQHETSELT